MVSLLEFRYKSILQTNHFSLNSRESHSFPLPPVWYLRYANYVHNSRWNLIFNHYFNHPTNCAIVVTENANEEQHVHSPVKSFTECLAHDSFSTWSPGKNTYMHTDSQSHFIPSHTHWIFGNTQSCYLYHTALVCVASFTLTHPHSTEKWNSFQRFQQTEDESTS